MCIVLQLRKGNTMPEINCLHCGKSRHVEQREINRGHGKFCNKKCANVYRALNIKSPEPNVKCAYCEKLFYLNDTKKKNSKSGLYFCCRKHKDAAQRVGGIQAIMPAHYGTGAPENTYRRIAFINKPKICERCGFNDHEAAIIVHHKDRNRMNDSIENLEVLCANCHAIEHWGETE
jgi:hypothetical protein